MRSFATARRRSWAIQNGYAHAWATILDSNVTTLIAGLALLAFGSGPVRGFAIVHCIGILTSMFSAVFFSRGLVNLWYGGKKKLQSLAIGQVWKPAGAAGAMSPMLERDAGTDTSRAVSAASSEAESPGAHRQTGGPPPQQSWRDATETGSSR